MEFFVIKNVLEKHGWNCLDKLFPKTVSDIYDWLFSDKKIIKNYENNLEILNAMLEYYNRELYDYFDSVRIQIYIFKKDKMFSCYINNEIAFLNTIDKFNERRSAEICGFINAMNVREKFLNEK